MLLANTFFLAASVPLANLDVAAQFLGISFVVGKEAIGHIQRREGPEEAALLLGIAMASVIVLSILCGLKLDLSVSSSDVCRYIQTKKNSSHVPTASLKAAFLAPCRG